MIGIYILYYANDSPVKWHFMLSVLMAFVFCVQCQFISSCYEFYQVKVLFKMQKMADHLRTGKKDPQAVHKIPIGMYNYIFNYLSFHLNNLEKSAIVKRKKYSLQIAKHCSHWSLMGFYEFDHNSKFSKVSYSISIAWVKNIRFKRIYIYAMDENLDILWSI